MRAYFVAKKKTSEKKYPLEKIFLRGKKRSNLILNYAKIPPRGCGALVVLHSKLGATSPELRVF